ncbi:MAG: hypothetical protein WC511_06125 [Candidatus Pacearchaeota archaeon]|jgi:hypothetical protein
MENIILAVIFIGTLAFIYFWQDKRDKSEETRFREFVIANKAKNVDEYVTALPSSEKIELPIEEELMDVNDVEPEELLQAIKKQNESK